MSTDVRQQQFEAFVREQPDIRQDARIARNFGFSNSARIIDGGLFACTNNLATYSAGLAANQQPPEKQFIFLCVLTFPPQDEVYFAIVVGREAGRMNAGLVKLFSEGQQRAQRNIAAGKPAGVINNNVKFYITKGGSLYFHNYEFLESLRDGPGGSTLDPDCSVAVDSIHFSIWPPAVSARRSLLARDFVGYLGSLIGRENVHELRTWPAAAAVNPDMRRMPSTLTLATIEAGIAALGGHYPGGEIRRFHTALNFLPHKHFVILSGLSGTGKTQLALKYARTVHGSDRDDTPDPFLVVCPVRPEWTDPTGLTGYEDALSNRYIVPPFLEAILLAIAHPESPVFVVLDEMNLAPVEYYLSDVLSAIETGAELQLYSSGVPLEGSTGAAVPAALPLPPNLYIIGTINIDESTTPITDKVLDRAVVIDMCVVDLEGFLAALQAREPALRASCGACEQLLVSLEKSLTEHRLGFGYRVAEEVVRYHFFATTGLGADPESTIDDLMVQKVLLKLRGSERQRPLLAALGSALKGMPQSEAFLDRLTEDLNEFGSFQANR